VHAGEGPDPESTALRLATAMLDGLPAEIRSIDVGFTALAPEGESRLVGELVRRPGSTRIDREAMERAIGPEDERFGISPPSGLRTVPVRDVTLEALADLDWRAFRGSLDERLIGSRIEEYQHVLASILGGSLGRFLDEASTALLTTGTPRLVGAILTSEQSARRAIFVDLMVDPELRRHGHGRFLVQWGLRALRALGYERVRLWVTVANAPARALYNDFGFVRTTGATIYRWDRPASGPQPQAGR
jgi:ribosomal protein S18 acetylase RimI-like enzyme